MTCTGSDLGKVWQEVIKEMIPRNIQSLIFTPSQRCGRCLLIGHACNGARSCNMCSKEEWPCRGIAEADRKGKPGRDSLALSPKVHPSLNGIDPLGAIRRTRRGPATETRPIHGTKLVVGSLHSTAVFPKLY